MSDRDFKLVKTLTATLTDAEARELPAFKNAPQNVAEIHIGNIQEKIDGKLYQVTYDLTRVDA